MGDGHGGIDKVASSWTLRGWLLLRGPFVGGALRGLSAAVTLRGLKSPSTWMYDSTTYRNHAKNLRVYIAFAPSKLLPLPSYANVLHSAAILLDLHV